jgi:hypothetical protein
MSNGCTLPHQSLHLVSHLPCPASDLQQQQIAPRGAYSNPTTPLAGSPDSSILASPMSALAGLSSSSGQSHSHSRLSGEHAHHAAAQHMEQVPEQQQLRLGTPSDPPGGLHNVGHGLRHGAAHLPTQAHQHVPHIPAELLRRSSAEAAALLTAAQRGTRGSADQAKPQQQQQGASGAAALVSHATGSTSSASVPAPGTSRAHSSSSTAAGGRGASGAAAKGGAGGGSSSSGGRAGGFGSVVEVDGLKTPLLSGFDGDDDSDAEQQ